MYRLNGKFFSDAIFSSLVARLFGSLRVMRRSAEPPSGISPPPHNFSRDAIEEAIDVEGFQLWRLGKKMEAQT